MGATSKDVLLDLARNPVKYAHEVGYTKLTDFHNAWIRDMVFGGGDMTIQGHRGSYKTTCLTFAFALLLVLRPNLRVMFIRKTDTDVAEVMKSVAGLIESPTIQGLAVALGGTPVQLTRATYSAVSTNLAGGASGAAQLTGYGIGGSLTGKHADLVFTDDIINLKDRLSASERRMTKMAYQELQNIRNRGGRIVNTGTPWHKNDCFELMPNIRRYDCYSTGLIMPDELKVLRSSMSASLFAANYELKHIADEDAIFTDAKFTADHELITDGIAHIDAGYGGADGTALTCINQDSSGNYYAYIRLWQKAVDEVLDEILSLCKRLRVGTIHCEKNADKGYLARQIRERGHPAQSYAERENKFIKITTYLKGAWPRVYLLDCPAFPLDNDALTQILDYNEHAEHDDMPDSLASAVRRFEQKTKFKGFTEGI